MRVIVDRIEQPHAPLIRMSIFDAPHRRMHIKTIQQYREVLRKAFEKAGMQTPIDYYIELSVLFIDPTSPDYDNLLTALFQAMDGKTLRKPGVLTDDGLVWTIRYLGKLYNNVA